MLSLWSGWWITNKAMYWRWWLGSFYDDQNSLAWSLREAVVILNRYRETSIINRTLSGNKFDDHSDVVGGSPVGTSPTTPSFSTKHLASMDWPETIARRDLKHLSVGIWCHLYYRFDGTPIKGLHVAYFRRMSLLLVPLLLVTAHAALTGNDDCAYDNGDTLYFLYFLIFDDI